MNVINRGNPGSSNVEILTELLSFEYKRNDIVVVGWTYIQRDTVFNRNNIFGNGNNKRLSAWTDNEIDKRWLEIYNEHDLAIKSGLHIHHANLYLESKYIRQYHFLAHMQSDYNIFEKGPQFIQKPKHFIDNIIFNRIDRASDNQHPGIKSHELLANKLYEHITQ